MIQRINITHLQLILSLLAVPLCVCVPDQILQNCQSRLAEIIHSLWQPERTDCLNLTITLTTDKKPKIRQNHIQEEID